MRTREQFIERAKQYEGIKYIYSDIGFIAWQMSTGENVEIMFIEVAEKKIGYGTELVRQMLKRINPYNSVFVFRLATNIEAGEFYKKLGFNEQIIRGLYKEDAVLHVASYKNLCQKLLIN